MSALLRQATHVLVAYWYSMGQETQVVGLSRDRLKATASLAGLGRETGARPADRSAGPVM